MYKMKMCKFVFYNSFIWDYFYPSFPILFSSLKRIDWEIEVEGKIVEYIYIYIYIERERERGNWDILFVSNVSIGVIHVMAANSIKWFSESLAHSLIS